MLKNRCLFDLENCDVLEYKYDWRLVLIKYRVVVCMMVVM